MRFFSPYMAHIEGDCNGGIRYGGAAGLWNVDELQEVWQLEEMACLQECDII